MKILIVSQHFYPEPFRINDIAVSLVQLGHDVSVLTGLPNYPSGKIPMEYRSGKLRTETYQGVEINRTWIVERGSNLLGMALNYVSFGINASIKILFSKKKYDLVFVFQTSPISMALPAIVAKYKQKIPMVIHCLDQWPISVTTGPIPEKSLLYRVLFHFSRWIYNQADVITLSSQSFKDYFKQALDLPESKGFLYWPSYAEDLYAIKEHESNEFFDLVFAGNIGPAQNVEMIIEAAHLLKNYASIRFHIVGDGLSFEKCKNIAKEYHLSNVVFHGSYPIDEMPRFYHLADAFLITMVDHSVINNTLPAKLQSYLLAGKPILAAINGEVRRVVEEAQAGLVVSSNDLDGFVESIRFASENPQLCHDWAENGLNYYHSHFDKAKLLSKLVSIFELLIERNKHASH